MKKIAFALLLFVLTAQSKAQSNSVSTTTSSNLSISVSVDDDDYTYSASFDKDITEKVRQAIEKTLGKVTDGSGRTAYWEGKGYSVELRQGKVRLEMDKDVVTKSFQIKFEDLGDQISEALGHEKAPKPPKPPKAPKSK